MPTSDPQKAAPSPRRRLGRAVLIGLAVAVLLVEIGFRVAVRARPKLEKWVDPIAFQLDRFRIEGHPYLGYAPKRNFSTLPTARHQISHNSLGFRGPETTWEKPPGVYRILCLGGSSTYGHGPSNNAATWPARLQEHLTQAVPERRIEVINGGAAGYSTFESLINLSLRGLDLEPDLVVVYHTINDMRCALYPDPRRDNAHWRAVWPRERRSAVRELAEKSYLFRIARTQLTDYVELRNDLGGYVIVDFAGRKDRYERGTPAETGFASFERNLNNIITLARANGAEIVLVTQGLRREDVSNEASGAAQLTAFDRMTGMLRTISAAREVTLIDAAPVMEAESRSQLEADGSQRIFTNEVHLFDEGADLLARVISEGVLAAGILP